MSRKARLPALGTCRSEAPRGVRPRVLCVGGTDPTGCAGIAADLRTAAALGAHGMPVVTAVTVQDSRGLHGAAAIPPVMVAAQIDAVLGGVGAQAVKIGMLANARIVQAVAGALERHPPAHVVLDPVLRATAGGTLLDEPGRRALVRRLLPLVTLLTPNIPEAEELTGIGIRSVDDMVAAARALLLRGARAVLLKGGHRRGDALDVFCDGAQPLLLRASRIATRNTRGTGCVLATAIACHLAQGLTLLEALVRGKAFVLEAIRRSYSLGSSRGPVDPLAAASASPRRRRA